MNRSFLSWIVEASARLAELLMLAMMALITVEIVCRSFLGFSLLLVDEVAGYVLVAILFLGVTTSFRSGSLLRVEFVINNLPARAQLWLDAAFDLIGFAFVAILDYALINFVRSTFERDMHAPTLLGTPLYIPQAVMPVGATLLAVALLASTVDKARRAWTGRIPDESGAR
ncbi:TRAP transporter small permease subunit [Reyranella sp.]|uniref:TRAP transporter small permease subunit n=1 Tax=Reyranella sp. TaxID=1929291 RepID=UPI003BAC6711